MLCRLRIENLVLVDSCEVEFGPGFNVITGESGAGKSVLLTAIGLLLGDKADSALVRQGEKMGFVEGEFSSAVVDEEGSCILRREIHRNGKSRAFVDDQQVNVQTLKQLGNNLIEISDQHACLDLKESDTPRRLLDEFARLDLEQFQKAYEHFKKLNARMETLKREEPLRAGEIERLKAQLEEIEASRVLEVDDKQLFCRLQELERTKELLELGSLVLSGLEEGYPSVCLLRQQAEKLSLGDVKDHLVTSSASLKDALHELESELSCLENPEEERTALEEQLKRIDRIHRQYGAEDIENAQAAMQERLSQLEGRDAEFDQLFSEIKKSQEKCDELASCLHQKRSKAARLFAQRIQKQIRNLNMPRARFEVEITQVPRTSTGDDHIQFFFTPNVGENRLEVGESASGGELARVYLAIQAVLAEVFSIPTVLFDEVDASIGGMTANAVGETLAAIGKKRQVLAVTHFVQVASKAHAHFVLTKEVCSGRTLSTVQELLSKQAKQQEHLRMVGAEAP